MNAIKDAFNAWWDGIARQGDPIRRPGLTEEAFETGYRAAASDCLTIRDQFAQAALPPVMYLCRSASLKEGETRPELFARNACEIADALMKARRA